MERDRRTGWLDLLRCLLAGGHRYGGRVLGRAGFFRRCARCGWSTYKLY